MAVRDEFGTVNEKKKCGKKWDKNKKIGGVIEQANNNNKRKLIKQIEENGKKEKWK